jgi:FPC/CPF motif-containing protein YcgG
VTRPAKCDVLLLEYLKKSSKRKKILTNVTSWKTLEDMLSEIKWAQKD